MNPQEFETYLQLFLHRSDLFAQQFNDGTYAPVRAELTPDEVQEHLAGFQTLGTYVLNVDNTVKYAVFDLDTYDEDAKSWLISSLTNSVLELAGGDIGSLKSLLLENSGGKGHHAWLFFDQPVPAVNVRAWANGPFIENWKLRADEALDKETGWPTAWPLEVFPKQDQLIEGGFGNLVKLPLGKHAVSGNWSTFEPVAGWAANLLEVVPLVGGLLPQETLAPIGTTVVTIEGEAGATPFPCVNRIISGDVPQGFRDRALFHLALYYFGHGLEKDLAIEACRRANGRFPQPLSPAEVVAKVGSAYTGRNPGARCGAEWLAAFCPGPCSVNKTVGRGSGGELRKCRLGDTFAVRVEGIQADGPQRRITVSHEGATNRPTFVVKVE